MLQSDKQPTSRGWGRPAARTGEAYDEEAHHWRAGRARRYRGHRLEAQRRSAPSIPSQFHGRWAENKGACKPRHFTSVITIDRRGWSSFEEGGRVTRTGQVRSGTHHFRVENHAGATETKGSLALRRVGSRIVMTFQDDGAPPVHHTLVRCRR